MPEVEVRARTQEDLARVLPRLQDAVSEGLSHFGELASEVVANRISLKVVKVMEDPEWINDDVEVIVRSTRLGSGQLNYASEAIGTLLLKMTDWSDGKLLTVDVRPLTRGHWTSE